MATDSKLQDATGLLRALANPQRLKILSVLAGGELSVGDLRSHIALTQSALSQHLARLRAQRLVATRRQSRTIYYRIVDEEALAMARALMGLAARREGCQRAAMPARLPGARDLSLQGPTSARLAGPIRPTDPHALAEDPRRSQAALWSRLPKSTMPKPTCGKSMRITSPPPSTGFTAPVRFRQLPRRGCRSRR